MRGRLHALAALAALLTFAVGRAQEAAVPSGLLYSTDHSLFTAVGTDTVFTIRDIQVSGNRRTRRATVLRELPFGTADSYPLSEIAEKLELAKRQLMNTNLFRNVTVSLQRTPEREVFVHVQVEERWYFFPQPFVRIANGSFSQWNDRGRPLEHLNYGVKLTQFNATGRADRAHIHLANGYTKRIAVQYQGFYFDRAMKWAGNFSFGHGKNRELNYKTDNNRLLAVKNPDGYLFEHWQSSFDLTYRPAIKTRHQFSVGYQYNRIGDTVLQLNKYYSPANTIYSYPYITYNVSFIDFDFNPYPTRGRYGDVSLHKAGISSTVNLWQLSVRGINYWGLGRRGYLSVRVGGTLKLPFRQPYITQQFMGYGDAFLQGYENYIIDGVAGGFAKQTIALNVLNTRVPVPTIKLLKSLRSVPIRAFLKAYTNQGYAHNPNPSFNDRLNNRLLYSGGLGLDLVVFTDLVFKFEYSWNQMGERGLFLHQ